ncbi:alpha/beta fold hydrolase [Saccharothrix sp. BKS2]|uniref:alpha/beta fold hydrolase n=1 Tax=Saccharothrix sp. BKS2 TaxID=3064400 RepID=UPI0039ED1CE9
MPRSTTTAASALTAAALVLGGITPITATAEAGNPFADHERQQLSWGPCAFPPGEDVRPAECALVTVPRDWAAPGAGPDLAVSISRVVATGERGGAVLVNPGGPGGQGTSLAGVLAALRPALNERYDIIGMDPRGTGQEGGTAPEQRGLVCSVPTGRLSTRTDLDARDRSADSVTEHLKAPRAIAEACQGQALTPYITTWQTAHDVELVRRLLGESSLNYLGYSYGTWLGAKYASLFPDAAGKVVLDSSVDWQGRLQAAFEAFPAINQRHVDQVFLPWASRQFPDLLGGSGAEAKRVWERVRAFYDARGLLAPDTYDAVFVGMGSEIRWALAALLLVLGAAELEGTAPGIANPRLRERLDAASLARFGVPVAGLTAATAAAATRAEDYTAVGGTRFAVACGDQPTRSASWYRRLSDRQGPRYPLFGWAYGLSEPCGHWSDAPRQTLPTLPASVSGRVLVVQAEFDPQTGYEQARSALRAAPGVTAVLVDDSPFHGQYALGGNPCVDGVVEVFLLANSRPGDIVCPGVPLPGEDEVHPVAGPVGRGTAAATAQQQAEPPSRLRELARERIAALNSP